MTAAQTGALPLSGGTMTGTIVQKDLTIHDGVNSRSVIQAYDDGDSANYGSEVTISGAGNTFVGAGEAATALRTALQAGAATGESYGKASERLYLAADNELFLYTNCNTIANRKMVKLSTAGALTVPDNTDYTTYKARNIAAGTTDLTAGSSALASGAIYLVYE